MHTTASTRSYGAGVALLPPADFVLGEWLVEPDLNQVSRNGVPAHVRPQLMDLLVYLARNTGRTVPHGELLAHVWPGQPFITGTALPRCIAELRQTLGDRASRSTLIQTIPKRGYRLIAAVTPADELPAVVMTAATPPSEPPAAPLFNGASSAQPTRGLAQAPQRDRPDAEPQRVEPAPVPQVGGLAPASPPNAEAGSHQPPARRSPGWLLRARQLLARVTRPFRSRAS